MSEGPDFSLSDFISLPFLLILEVVVLVFKKVNIFTGLLSPRRHLQDMMKQLLDELGFYVLDGRLVFHFKEKEKGNGNRFLRRSLH